MLLLLLSICRNPHAAPTMPHTGAGWVLLCLSCSTCWPMPKLESSLNISSASAVFSILVPIFKLPSRCLQTLLIMVASGMPSPCCFPQGQWLVLQGRGFWSIAWLCTSSKSSADCMSAPPSCFVSQTNS